MSSEYPVVFSFNGVEHHVEIQSARDLVARINKSIAAAIDPTPICADPRDVGAVYDEADKRWSEASDFVAQFLACPTLEDIALCRDMLEVFHAQSATEAAEAARSQLAVAVEALETIARYGEDLDEKRAREALAKLRAAKEGL